MAERASVFGQNQWGVETTSGVSVAANKLLQSWDIIETASIGVDFYRAQGLKYPSLGIAGKDLTMAQLRGKPCYTDIVYLLSGLFGAAVITGPNTDGAYTWVFSPSSSAPDAFKTFTIERGSSVAAEKFTYGLPSQFGLEFDRGVANLTGALLGQALTTGITLTATPTAIPMVPMSPKDFSVWADPTSGALGTTKLTRLLKGNFVFGGSKYLPLWVVDQAQTSFAAVVEGAPDATFRALFAADATAGQGVSFLANVRAGDTRFVRIKATGPLIAGATNHSFTIDMAAKFDDPGPFHDESGVYAYELPWNLVTDPTWGKALTLTVVTTTATL